MERFFKAVGSILLAISCKRVQALTCAMWIFALCVAAPCFATEDRGPDRVTSIKSLSWSPDGGSIVFSTDRKYENKGVEACYLWRVKLDGTGLQQITFPAREEKDKTTHFQDQNPHWSPDGKQIAFDSNRSSAVAKKWPLNLRQIFVCDPQGKNLHELSDNMGRFWNQEPRWSPDGEHLVWVTTRNGSADIILATKEGKELKWLALNSKLREFCPSWSKDGSRLIYLTEPERPTDKPSLNICVKNTDIQKKNEKETSQIEADKKQVSVLVAHPSSFGLIGMCSPTEDRVAFIKQSMPTDIWSIRLDGSNLQRITDSHKQRISVNDLVPPTWAPKGDRLAFVAKSRRVLPADVYEEGIWILNVKDGSVTEIPLPLVKD